MFLNYMPLIISVVPFIAAITNIILNTQKKANPTKSYSARLMNLIIFLIIFLAVMLQTIIKGLNIIFGIYAVIAAAVIILQIVKRKSKSSNMNISFIGVRKIMTIIKGVLIENNLSFQVYNNAIVVPQLKAQLITKGRFRNVTVKYSIHVKTPEFSRLWDLIQDRIRESSEKSRKIRENMGNILMLVFSIISFAYFFLSIIL